MEYRDYYNVLGLDRNATPEEIKKAFRKQARRYHPDVNPGDEVSAEKFREVNEANEVLSDPEKRQKYDQLGSRWKEYESGGGSPEDFNWTDSRSSGGSYTYTTVDPADFEDLFGTGGGYSDFFESLFGGAGGGQTDAGGRAYSYEPRPRKGMDGEHSLEVSLDEAFHGSNRILEWEDGRKVRATIPPGVKTGSRIRLKGQGGQGHGGGKPGDLYLNIEVAPDERFGRDGDDLTTTEQVDLFTMLLGGKRSVSGIDGRTVKMDIPPETRNGRIFRLTGLGMPKIKSPKKRGDLYITVETQLPTDLDSEEKELVERWSEKSREKQSGGRK